MADQTVTQHRDLAAFHTYEMGRAHAPELPDWDSEQAAPQRTEHRYLITAAARRAQPECVLMAIEVIAAKLAEADGQTWPACDQWISLQRADFVRAAITAERRQRYRHLARVAHAAVTTYYELGTEDAAMRQRVIAEAQAQEQDDKATMTTYREQIGTRR